MVELNEKALEQDRARLIHILVVHFDMFRDKAEEAADLFLHDKTLPAPDDGLEVVAWRWPEPHVEGGALYSVTNVEPPCSGWQGLVLLSDAQAALQHKDEQIERLTSEIAELRGHLLLANRSSVNGMMRENEYLARAEALEQQVQKLTAENERLRDAIRQLGDKI